MQKPHILIFNPDQWRGDVLGHMGNPAASTPVLDECVERDFVSFRNAFCQNPVCTPSRCSFMTGWYPHVRGHRTMYHMLRPDEPCLLKILKNNDYFVWWGGKNDLVPAQNGFENYCDIKFRATDEDWQRWSHQPRHDLHSTASIWRGAPGSDTYYSFFAGELETGDDTIYGNDDWAQIFGAIDFIRSYDGDKPLCIYLPLSYPHPPYAVEEPWFSMIDRDKLPPRIPAPEDWKDKPLLLQGIYECQNLMSWTEDRWNELRAIYYGMCARVDYQFGLVLDALREKDLYDDTAAFFFSDHGDFTGDYGLVEKTQNTFEDCLTHVPLLIKPPKSTSVQPRVSDALVELIDFPATAYELLGVEPGYDHFGQSLLPILTGQTDEHRHAVFCEGGRRASETHCNEAASSSSGDPAGLYWPRVNLQRQIPEHTKAVMCRTREFKYVRRLYERDELYDLRNDPGETSNRIDDPVLVHERDSLREKLLSWLLETADVVPFELDSR